VGEVCVEKRRSSIGGGEGGGCVGVL